MFARHLPRGRGIFRAVLAEPTASLSDELVDAPVIDAVLPGELGDRGSAVGSYFARKNGPSTG